MIFFNKHGSVYFEDAREKEVLHLSSIWVLFLLFCFVLFFFSPLCIHTYIYEFSCWILFKAHRLVNKHDTKDTYELKEDHNISFSVGFGVWAQFRDKFLMHRKLLNSNCLIAFSFFGQWLKRKPVSSNSMLVNRIIFLVSFLFFIWKFYLSIMNVLCMGLDFVVSHFVCKKWHE